MIDMVFQLIAFFMVIVNFTEADQDERVSLPLSELAKPPQAPPENLLTINVGAEKTKDGTVVGPWEVFMSGRMVGDEMSLDPLAEQLERERGFVVRKGENPNEVVVIIRADIQAPTGLVQKVIQAAQDVKFEQFALRAKEDNEF